MLPPLLPIPRASAAARAPHPTFHGAQRLPHPFRNLGLRHALEIGQFDGFTLLPGEFFQRRLDLPDQVEPQRIGLHGCKQRRILRFAQFQRRFGTPAAIAEIINRPVARYGQQPRPDRAPLGIETAHSVPNAEERLLHQIFRGAAILNDPQYQTENDASVAVVQLGEGLWIALL